MWVEVTTLIIPDQNDDEKELTEIGHFIADVDTDIPWHISRFHPGYQFADSQATPSAHPVEKRFPAFLQIKGELLDPLGKNGKP